MIDFIFDNIFVVGVIAFGIAKVIGGMRKETKGREKEKPQRREAPRQQPIVSQQPVRQKVVSQQTVTQKPMSQRPVPQTQKQIKVQDIATKIRREVEQQAQRVVMQIPVQPQRKFPEPKVLDRTYKQPMTSDEVAYATTEDTAYEIPQHSRLSMPKVKTVTVRAATAPGKGTNVAVSLDVKETDLQRAFVMAEVLGRPRARQKRTRW